MKPADKLLAKPRSSRTRVTGVAWLATENLTLENWAACGKRLGMLGRGVGWWIGDWLLYGNEHYGEKYTRAARITAYDVQTLMNMVYVASRFSPERRREELSWSHHAELAAFEPAEQEHWLDLAILERISVRSLRLEIRRAKRAPEAADPKAEVQRGIESARGGRAQDEKLLCPNCQHVFEAPSNSTEPAEALRT